ncbi:hypothetical protein KAI92_04295 [Candidatus Parcubacteria bacterium]|nr:hypothetical protein [Candidatus Parcubacteria bacterium]
MKSESGGTAMSLFCCVIFSYLVGSLITVYYPKNEDVEVKNNYSEVQEIARIATLKSVFIAYDEFNKDENSQTFNELVKAMNEYKKVVGNTDDVVWFEEEVIKKEGKLLNQQ